MRTLKLKLLSKENSSFDSNDIVNLELSGRETENELRELISCFVCCDPNEIKGIKDSFNTYYTLSSIISNKEINSQKNNKIYQLVLRRNDKNKFQIKIICLQDILTKPYLDELKNNMTKGNLINKNSNINTKNNNKKNIETISNQRNNFIENKKINYSNKIESKTRNFFQSNFQNNCLDQDYFRKSKNYINKDFDSIKQKIKGKLEFDRNKNYGINDTNEGLLTQNSSKKKFKNFQNKINFLNTNDYKVNDTNDIFINKKKLKKNLKKKSESGEYILEKENEFKINKKLEYSDYYNLGDFNQFENKECLNYDDIKNYKFYNCNKNNEPNIQKEKILLTSNNKNEDLFNLNLRTKYNLLNLQNLNEEGNTNNLNRFKSMPKISGIDTLIKDENQIFCFQEKKKIKSTESSQSDFEILTFFRYLFLSKKITFEGFSKIHSYIKDKKNCKILFDLLRIFFQEIIDEKAFINSVLKLTESEINKNANNYDYNIEEGKNNNINNFIVSKPHINKYKEKLTELFTIKNNKYLDNPNDLEILLNLVECENEELFSEFNIYLEYYNFDNFLKSVKLLIDKNRKNINPIPPNQLREDIITNHSGNSNFCFNLNNKLNKNFSSKSKKLTNILKNLNYSPVINNFSIKKEDLENNNFSLGNQKNFISYGINCTPESENKTITEIHTNHNLITNNANFESTRNESKVGIVNNENFKKIDLINQDSYEDIYNKKSEKYMENKIYSSNNTSDKNLNNNILMNLINFIDKKNDFKESFFESTLTEKNYSVLTQTQNLSVNSELSNMVQTIQNTSFTSDFSNYNKNSINNINIRGCNNDDETENNDYNKKSYNKNKSKEIIKYNIHDTNKNEVDYFNKPNNGILLLGNGNIKNNINKIELEIFNRNLFNKGENNLNKIDEGNISPVLYNIKEKNLIKFERDLFEFKKFILSIKCLDDHEIDYLNNLEYEKNKEIIKIMNIYWEERNILNLKNSIRILIQNQACNDKILKEIQNDEKLYLNENNCINEKFHTPVKNNKKYFDINNKEIDKINISNQKSSDKLKNSPNHKIKELKNNIKNINIENGEKVKELINYSNKKPSENENFISFMNNYNHQITFSKNLNFSSMKRSVSKKNSNSTDLSNKNINHLKFNLNEREKMQQIKNNHNHNDISIITLSNKCLKNNFNEQLEDIKLENNQLESQNIKIKFNNEKINLLNFEPKKIDEENSKLFSGSSYLKVDLLKSSEQIKNDKDIDIENNKNENFKSSNYRKSPIDDKENIFIFNNVCSKIMLNNEIQKKNSLKKLEKNEIKENLNKFQKSKGSNDSSKKEKKKDIINENYNLRKFTFYIENNTPNHNNRIDQISQNNFNNQEVNTAGLVQKIDFSRENNTTEFEKIQIINSNLSEKNDQVLNTNFIFKSFYSSLKEFLFDFKIAGNISNHQYKYLVQRYENNEKMLLNAWEIYQYNFNLNELIESLKNFSTNVRKNEKINSQGKGYTPFAISNRKNYLLEMLKNQEHEERRPIHEKQINIIELLAKEKLIDSSNLLIIKELIIEENLFIISAFEILSVSKDIWEFSESIELIVETFLNSDEGKTWKLEKSEKSKNFKISSNMM